MVLRSEKERLRNGVKFTIALFSFLAFFSAIQAQGIISPTWTKIDTSDHETSEAWGVDVDAAGHVYWVVSSNQLNQGLDISCYKFDNTGAPLWLAPMVYGGPGTQHAYVCNASDTALYIGGRECPFFLLSCDMLLLKVDKSNGNIIWDKRNNYSANGYDEVDGLEILPDGIYCGGWSQELLSTIYRSDIGLWKLDFNGNTQWTNYLGIDSTAEHQDGHFVVDGNQIFAAGLWGGTGWANSYNGHAFLGKFSKADGSLVDSTLFGTQSSVPGDIENALGMTSDGTYLYVTGYTTPVSVFDWQLFVAKYDKNLNQLWYTDWGGTGSESARGIKVVGDKIYVAGLTESDSLMSGGERDGLLLTLDTAGNVLSYQTYGGPEMESFQDIAVHNNMIYLTGRIEDPADTTKRKSLLLAVADSTLTIAEEVDAIVNAFVIFPNPALGRARIRFQRPVHEAGTLRVFDMAGVEVSNQHFGSDTEEVLLEFKGSGLFMVELTFSDYRTVRSVMNR